MATINGTQNPDLLEGGAESDSISGGAGNDTILGGGGNDTIVGGGGSDQVSGGAGADVFGFDGDPFDGIDVSAPGRQFAGAEDFISDFDIATQLTSIAVASAPTNSAVLASALAGNIYFNFHSLTFPAGEVRGQLALVFDDRAADGTGSVTFTSTLSPTNEVANPPVVSDAIGVGTITFTVAPDGGVAYTTQVNVRDFDVSQLTVGHLHQAPGGANGPVVTDVVQDARDNGSIEGSIEADAYRFDAKDFGISGAFSFQSIDGNAPGASLQPGANVVVLTNSDNDANAATPFNAGAAANQVAELATTDGAGVFVYFNSALNLNRIVYSSNLNDPTADLKIVSRQTDLTGSAAIDALQDFTADNFSFQGETEVGGQGIDILTGFGGDDKLRGKGGADQLFGGEGDDVLNGQSGDDALNGGLGRDSLLGSGGSDSLNGGGGRDSLSGGTDADVDTFVFSALSDSTTERYGRDVINDFDSGEDRIDLTALNLSSFDQVQIIERANGVTVVRIDADTDGAFDDFGLKFKGATPVEADFIL